jgi:adenylate cyclase
LCADAGAWQILLTQRVRAAAGDSVDCEPVGAVQPRGFSRSFEIFRITGDHLSGTGR